MFPCANYSKIVKNGNHPKNEILEPDLSSSLLSDGDLHCVIEWHSCCVVYHSIIQLWAGSTVPLHLGVYFAQSALINTWDQTEIVVT